MKTAQIRQFLGSLSDLDYRFLRIQCSMANDARNLIKEFNLDKDELCSLIRIEPDQYDSYLTGGFDYDIEKMALMQAAFINLAAVRYKKELDGKITDIKTE